MFKSLKGRVYFGLGIVLVSVVILSVVTFFTTRALTQSLDHLHENLYETSLGILELESHVLRHLGLYEEGLMMEDSGALDKADQQMSTITYLIGSIQNHIDQNSHLSNALKEFASKYIVYNQKKSAIYRTFLYNPQNYNAQSNIQQLSQERFLIQKQLQKLRQDSQNLLKKHIIDISKKSSFWGHLVHVIQIICLLSLSITAWFFLRAIVDRMSALQLAAETTSRSVETPLPDLGNDELGQLSHTVENMRQTILRDRQEIIRKQLEAEKASKGKSEFLANMSHEIRTPMNTILGMTEELAEENLTPSQRECVNATLSTGNHLLELINDILDLSKIESGRWRIQYTDVDLATFSQQLMTSMKALARPNVGLSIDIDPDLPQVIQSDRQMLWQIIVNLMGNALKFTEEGHVTVFFKFNEDPSFWQIDVKDTGIGIPPEQTEKVFSVFTQADTSTSKKYGGTGLGLSICRRLSQLLKGQVHVQSVEGQGSCFSVVLPYRPAHSQDKNSPSAHTGNHSEPLSVGRGEHILLVEDNEDNQILMKRYFKKTNYKIELAENGKEALRQVKADHFDLILMDLQMPIMDGYEATASIREWQAENQKERTPILALSAYGREEERQLSTKAGCDDHLTKPIKKKVLFENIEKWLRQDSSTNEEPAESV